MLCYKVVCHDRLAGRRRSVCPPAEDLSVTYRPQEWTEASVGGLFVFSISGLSQAKAFACSPGDEVWLAEAEEEMRLPSRPKTIEAAADAEQLSWAWRESKAEPWDWPSGVAAYRRVKLLRQL